MELLHLVRMTPLVHPEKLVFEGLEHCLRVLVKIDRPHFLFIDNFYAVWKTM